jgi:hypothetical protein
MKVDIINNVKCAHLGKAKIGQCVKCKAFMSVCWLWPDMTWYRDYCYRCKNFRKFTVTTLKET